METVIRLANTYDAEELSLMNYEFNDVKIRNEQVRNSLRNSDEIIAIAKVGEKHAGFACAQKFDSFCYEKPQGEITEVYVRKEYRRKGIASAMVEFLEKRLSSVGVGEVKILTDINNEAAIKTYTLSGYKNKTKVVLKKDF